MEEFGDIMGKKKLTLGRRLKIVRERSGLSQGELERESGIALSLISRYERDVVTPMWPQVERILTALKMTPCDLFSDYCDEREDGWDTFVIGYHDRRPPDPDEPCEPTKLRFRKNGPLVSLMSLVAVDDRYTIVRFISDMMVPDVYPGDLTLTDTTLAAASGRVIAGYLDGEPVAGRLIRHHGKVYIVPSNRRYPPMEYDADRWQHRGCIIYSMRDLTSRFMAGKRFTDENSDVISIEQLDGGGRQR